MDRVPGEPETAIDEIEAGIRNLIRGDETLKRQHGLLLSRALLHMVAMSAATRTKGELSEYYIRKVNEGKNKIPVINAVRAKLVMRMFAVIKNNIFYGKNYVFCLYKS